MLIRRECRRATLLNYAVGRNAAYTQGSRMTSLEGFHQIAHMMEIFIEHGADPTAQITWTRQVCISSTRQTFKRTATEQIRASFIDCFSA